MKLLVTAALIALLINACREPEKQAGKEETETQSAYIPVTEYIRNEIKAVDSLPVGILKRVIRGARSDSAYITPQEFSLLAAEFLPKELENGAFEQSFTESSFFDQTTESLTFTYQATDPASSVRRVDVLAAPSLQLDKIKSIYIEKAYKANDTAFNKKLYWKAGTSFHIITEMSLPEKPPVVHQVKVIWDPLNY